MKYFVTEDFYEEPVFTGDKQYKRRTSKRHEHSYTFKTFLNAHSLD